MKFSEIMLLIAVVVVVVELIRIRVTFMIKGIKLNAVVKDYVLSKEGAYSPIMEFSHNGEILNIKHKGADKKKKYELGTEFEIMYIPGKNDYVKIVQDYTDIKTGASILVCGIVLFISLLLK